jgi:hypothetical protein
VPSRRPFRSIDSALNRYFQDEAFSEKKSAVQRTCPLVRRCGALVHFGVEVKLKLSFSGSEVIEQSADKLNGVTKKSIRWCGDAELALQLRVNSNWSKNDQ